MVETRQEVMEITLKELRGLTIVITEALEGSPTLRALSHARLAVLHAYFTGCVMAGAGLTPDSAQALLEFVRIGYNDYEAIIQDDDEGEEEVTKQ